MASDVLLRAMQESDLPELTGGDSEFDDWGSREPRRTVARSDPSGAGMLTITDAASGEVLGDVSWHWVHWGPTRESHNPMIGIWLKRTARGRGVGANAQRLLVDKLFTETETNRIEAHTDVANLAEQRALERVGFAREGVVRGAQWRRGSWHDLYLYSILRADWQQQVIRSITTA
ncbi:MAG TPA: GNAT family protein [Nitrolancea sp.]|nr:GNAT family protein [Nitrolancea sp.]